MSNLQFTVDRTTTRRGFTIRYPVRQVHLGDGMHSGWYKFRRDAQRRADELNSCWELMLEMAQDARRDEDRRLP